MHIHIYIGYILYMREISHIYMYIHIDVYMCMYKCIHISYNDREIS